MADSSPHPTVTSTFASRAADAHPLTSYLLRLMTLKTSNLCFSADVSTARQLLTLADKVGPSIVVLKTHYDLVSRWDFHHHTGTGSKLAALARKHGFLIFEDRKFGDIGSTVQQQYVGGSARVIDWAHITNVNMVPGPAIVSALEEAAIRWKGRLHCGVNTSVSAGDPFPEDSSEDEDEDGSDSDSANPSLVDLRDLDGRKGSIVSVTTVTQSFEHVDTLHHKKDTRKEEVIYPGIEEAPHDRGLLILAQMSSAGNFMNAEYTNACVETARQHKGFVMGFVAQESLNTKVDDNFITMTPGCNLPPEHEHDPADIASDGLGQQYNTPEKIVAGAGCDIVIVGRGITKACNPQLEAERYRKAAWKAYMSRLS